MMLLNILKIPPGVTRRKSSASGDTSGNSVTELLTQHDFINTMVDITADDVCIGNSPAYVEGDENLRSPKLKSRLDALLHAVNGIVRWAAVDILKYGVSGYALCTDNNNVPHLVPILNSSLSFYMSKTGTVVTYRDGIRCGDLLVFLNYSKSSLQPLDGGCALPDDRDDLLYQIVPEPIQLKYVDKVARDLFAEERAMYTYRQQAARWVRMIAVDVGVSQGDKTQEVIDDISSVVNSDSMSLSMQAPMESSFQDQIPILPTRKGLGKPEIIESIPEFDISKMADLDYTINRLFLAMRFPKSYADFSQTVDATAVSLIRGDIRYARMVDYARSLLEDTLNAWVCNVLPKVTFKLTSIPTSEDSDVVEALRTYTEFAGNSFEYINQASDLSEARSRLDSVKVLLGDAASQKSIQLWYQTMSDYIDTKYSPNAGADDVDKGTSDMSFVGSEDDSPGIE